MKTTKVNLLIIVCFVSLVVNTLAGCKKDTVAVTGVTISPISAPFAPGFSQQLTATVLPTDATNKELTWSSSNTDRAMVCDNGIVTIPVTATIGNVTITATTVDRGLTANFEIAVDPIVTDFSVTVSGTYTYNGTPIEPSGENVTVKVGDVTLTVGANYTLSYSDNINAGTATVMAAGVGVFSESAGSANFTIAPCQINVTANDVSKVFGDNDPTLTYTTTSVLFGSDVLEGTLIRTDGEEVGKYAITQGMLSAGGNYEIAFTEGIFTIDYFAGKGTNDVPYEIHSPSQLAKLAELVNTGIDAYNRRYYKLTADINLSAYGSDWLYGKGWIPIGVGVEDFTAHDRFRGRFDGNNHKVNGLYINNDELDYVGLFGHIEGGIVHNLGVEGVVSGRMVGGLAGTVYSGGSIINCYAAVVISGKYFVGGVVGLLGLDSSITNCYTTGVVSGADQYVGGVAGYVGGSLTNCYAMSAVSGNKDVGGVVGFAEGSVTNCYATGAVSGSYNVGGIAGYVGGSVKNCVALNPNVSFISDPDARFGRIAGVNYGSIANNVAWDGMTVVNATVTSIYGASPHGADITSSVAKTQATYSGTGENQLGWKFGNDDTNPWKWGGAFYPLPVLHWQESSKHPTLPEHLQ